MSVSRGEDAGSEARGQWGTAVGQYNRENLARHVSLANVQYLFRQVMSAVQGEGGALSASTARQIATSVLASQSFLVRLAFRLPLVQLNEPALVTIHSHGPDALAPMLARALAWSPVLGRFPE